MRCYEVRAYTPMLGELQVERVNLLGTDVAGEDRSSTRIETRPRARTELITVGANFGQVGKPFDFSVTDAQAEESGVVLQDRVEVDVVAVARPREIAEGTLLRVHLPPLLGLGVVEHQFAIARGGDSNDVATIG